MTVIAWDGHVLAADRQVTNGDTVSSGIKLWPLKQGGAVAVCGALSQGLALRRWVEEGMIREKFPAVKEDEEWARLIVALPGKPVIMFENTPEAIEVIDPFLAWGCGREAALGAMEMGADAITAVKIASKWIVGCGNGCDYVIVNNKRNVSAPKRYNSKGWGADGLERKAVGI